jgi:tight adherence protein B
MNPSLLTVAIFAVVALCLGTVFFLLRDLFGRRRTTKSSDAKILDLGSLLPPAVETPKDRSWFGRLAVESGRGLTADTAFLMVLLAGMTAGCAMFLWRDDPLAGVTGAVFGVLLACGSLVVLRARRYNAIREQLPDCMELMARAVRAGESLDQAIALVGDSPLQPVAAEFRYCSSQMKMGLSLESAIRGMIERVPLFETRILALTLIVQRRRGGSLPVTLERLARVFRDRLSFLRQFRVATALGRGSAALISLIALGLDAFVVFGNSEFASRLLTTNPGRLILAGSLLLQVMGIAWTLWLFRSRY